jgi:hypothetical protein
VVLYQVQVAGVVEHRLNIIPPLLYRDHNLILLAQYLVLPHLAQHPQQLYQLLAAHLAVQVD